MNYNLKQALKIGDEIENFSFQNKIEEIGGGETAFYNILDDFLDLFDEFKEFAKNIDDNKLNKLLDSIDLSFNDDDYIDVYLGRFMGAIEHLRNIGAGNPVQINTLSEIEQFFYNHLIITNTKCVGISFEEWLDCYEPGEGEVYSENTLKDLIKRLKEKRGIEHIRGVGYFDPRVLPAEHQENKKKSKKNSR